jgi:hypothetical protein
MPNSKKIMPQFKVGAVLTAEMSRREKIERMIWVCRTMGLTVSEETEREALEDARLVDNMQRVIASRVTFTEEELAAAEERLRHKSSYDYFNTEDLAEIEVQERRAWERRKLKAKRGFQIPKPPSSDEE